MEILMIDVQTKVIIAVIGLIQAVVVAFMGLLYRRDSLKRTQMLQNAEVRAALRAEESRLAMELMDAMLKISRATAVAVRNDQSNGEMANALAIVDKTAGKYQNFLQAIAAERITK